MGNRLQIALPAETGSLLAIRNFVEDACSQAGLDDSTSYDIKLAVDEACMNIVEHGYAGMDPGSILVSLMYGARKLVVRITDFGHPFEPSEPPKPDPQKTIPSGVGGFGLHFIYRSVDSVGYEATESGNTLTLVKDLGVAESEGGTVMESMPVQSSDVAVVSITYDLDAATSAETAARLGAEIEAGRPKLVLDLGGVPYLSSAGLRVILGAMREARQQGGDLRLAGAEGDILRVLDMAGFPTFMQMFPTVEEAAASYGQSG